MLYSKESTSVVMHDLMVCSVARHSACLHKVKLAEMPSTHKSSILVLNGTLACAIILVTVLPDVGLY